MLNLLLKPIFWVLIVGVIGGGFLVFRITTTVNCGPGKVLQGIFPTICVNFSGSVGSSALSPTSSSSGTSGSVTGGPGCTGNVGVTGPGLTTGTAICSVFCPAGKKAKILKYTGTGDPFVSYDAAQGKYICNGKPTIGASSIQCECQ